MADSRKTQVRVGGNVSGQVANGDHNVQIQNEGGVVNVFKSPPFKKRARSNRQTPVPHADLLDRAPETKIIQSAVEKGFSASVFGEGGVGKTTFLTHLAQLPEVKQYPDGAVYLYVNGQGFDDLLQMLFDTFFSSIGNIMPSTGQLRHRLQGIRAFILLDELSLSREDAQALIAIMPVSCFVFASLERNLWGEGEVIPLAGLPEQEQVELFAREVKRPLTEAEKTDALIICYYLQGHPLKIIQAASLVSSGSRSVSEIKKQYQGNPTPLSIVKELLQSLNPSQQKTLALLGASGGTLVPLAIISSLLKMPGAQEVLKGLVSAGLAWTDGSRFGLAGSMIGPISELWNLSSWEDTLINHVTSWLAQKPNDALIEDASDTLAHLIKKAGERNRLPEVIRIGRALEQILVLGRRWQKWLDILKLILKAARALHDRSTEAWALHQLGTRALCLNYADQAGQFLNQALNIRRAIGDRAGMAVTQHNLNMLQGGAPINIEPKKPPQVKSEIGKYLAYGFGGMATLGVIGLIGLWLWLQPLPAPLPTQTSIPVIIPSATFPFTSTPSIFTPTYTNTFTETSTSTVTPSFTSTYTVTASITPSITPSRTSTVTPSRTSTITAFVPQPPPAPVIVTPYKSESVCSGSISLVWKESNDPIGISNYQIQLQYRPTPTEWAPLIDKVVPPTPTEYNTPAYGDGVYRWRVRAKNNGGIWGAWSSWTGFFLNYCEP